MKTRSEESFIYRCALLALLVLAAGYFATPVSDVDTWWHLASGRYIAQTGTLPDSDPFGVYQTINYWGETVLKGQWLGQLSLYGAYSVGDLDGVVALRAALLVCCIALIALRSTLGGYSGLSALPFLFLAAMALRGHVADRPQLYSFLAFAATALVLDWYRSKQNPVVLYALPLLFVMWANLHPGVLLGLAFLGAFCFFLVIEDRLGPSRTGLDRAFLHLAIVCILCAVATLATPNGLTSYVYLLKLESDPLKDLVTEYLSPFELFSKTAMAPYLIYYWVICAASLALFVSLAWKKRVVEASLTLLMVLLSFNAYRYIPFMIIYTVPLLARQTAPVLNRLKPRLRSGMLAASVLTFVCLLAFETRAGKMFHGGAYEQRYPVALSDKVLEQGLGGRIFNSLQWGGYLIWKLWPDATVFFDGRMMESDRVKPYTHVLWMTDYGRAYFEKANFDMVMVSHGNPFAQEEKRYPLVTYLHRSPGWRLVYVDEMGVLYARR